MKGFLFGVFIVGGIVEVFFNATAGLLCFVVAALIDISEKLDKLIKKD